MTPPFIGERILLGTSMFRFYSFKKDSAIIPKLYNVAYALSIATSGKASRILLAGFDGYDQKDNRNKIINEIFYAYKENKSSKSIISITPTKYNFSTISIYAIRN